MAFRYVFSARHVKCDVVCEWIAYCSFYSCDMLILASYTLSFSLLDAYNVVVI